MYSFYKFVQFYKINEMLDKLFLLNFNYLMQADQFIYIKNDKCWFNIPRSLSFSMLFAPAKSGNPEVA